MIRSVAPLGRGLSTIAPPNAVGSTILHLLALERIHNTRTLGEKHKVPHSCSHAEENASFINRVQHDEK
jgi:hypothetical protein